MEEFVDRRETFLSSCHRRLIHFHKRIFGFRKWARCRLMVRLMHPSYLILLYYLVVTVLGLVALVMFDRVKPDRYNRVSSFDLFFMSASTTTASSLASVNMEDMSNSQFVVLIFLMFVGGEVILSSITLLFNSLNLHGVGLRPEDCNSSEEDVETRAAKNGGVGHYLCDRQGTGSESNVVNDLDLQMRSTKCLANVALGFYILVIFFGSLMVFAYLKMFTSARSILREKGLNPGTFAVFATVSSLVNCGFLPNNENMVVFRRDSGLLWMVIGQILVGNTLYPVCLTLVLCILVKYFPRKEHDYLWKRGQELGYVHLFPWKVSVYLAMSAVGFTMLQLVMFGFLEWDSAAVPGELSFYQKLVAGIFQSVSARHAGEMAFDMSAFSQALLVVYIVMMYLPPYTFMVPIKMAGTIRNDDDNDDKNRNKVKNYLLLPQVGYLVVFVVLVCLTERRQLQEDPLNFNVMNIVFEVTSAYGNVGLTTGYSCSRLQKITNRPCQDSWVSFSGKWSRKGQVLILIVMFMGRLKKYTPGGKAWVTVL